MSGPDGGNEDFRFARPRQCAAVRDDDRLMRKTAIVLAPRVSRRSVVQLRHRQPHRACRTITRRPAEVSVRNSHQSSRRIHRLDEHASDSPETSCFRASGRRGGGGSIERKQGRQEYQLTQPGWLRATASSTTVVSSRRGRRDTNAYLKRKASGSSAYWSDLFTDQHLSPSVMMALGSSTPREQVGAFPARLRMRPGLRRYPDSG